LGFDADGTAPDTGILEDGISHIYKSGVFRKTGCDPTNPVLAETETRELQVAARTLGLRLVTLDASDPNEFETAFATLVRERASGLVASSDTLFLRHSDQLVALAARCRVPAAYGDREITSAGGLMSYGTDLPSAWRQIGVYAARILKGEKPADLPVQQATKIHLAINLKTAKELDLTIPETLLATADEGRPPRQTFRPWTRRACLDCTSRIGLRFSPPARRRRM